MPSFPSKRRLTRCPAKTFDAQRQHDPYHKDRCKTVAQNNKTLVGSD